MACVAQDALVGSARNYRGPGSTLLRAHELVAAAEAMRQLRRGTRSGAGGVGGGGEVGALELPSPAVTKQSVVACAVGRRIEVCCTCCTAARGGTLPFLPCPASIA